MRSILFKLSEKEALAFKVIRGNSMPNILTPRKFFLSAMQVELEKIERAALVSSDGESS